MFSQDTGSYGIVTNPKTENQTFVKNFKTVFMVEAYEQCV